MRDCLKKNNQRGFTLFELIVAIAVVGLMVGLVVTQVDNWFDLNVKKATKRLSSTVRYLHDKASTQNLYMRLVFDFEKNSYWVEATTEQFLLTSKELLEEEAEEIGKEEGEEVEEGVEGEEGEEVAAPVKKYRTPQFGSVDEYLLKPVALPDGVFIKDVYTSHDIGAVEGGQAFIYFFPNGYIEPAIINLRDDDDETHFSIEINPIMGSTIIESQYKQMEE